MFEKSIAVLPFLNMSSDPENEYFSDGITEELINSISQVSGLKVTARTSSFVFKGKQMDVRHIGNQLGVATVLEGSIRKAGNRVRISAQLIRTTDGFQIWSEKFDRDLVDIFELQEEISQEIVEHIRENFGHLEIRDQLVDAPTDNVEAYNLYLKARYFHLRWDGEGIRKAIELYSQCIGMAPDFSWPYFGIAFCFAMSGSWGNKPEFVTLAEEYLEKGYSLDPESPLGHFAKASTAFWGKWDTNTGLEYYKKAIGLNPSYTEAEEGLAELYTALGNFDQAMHHTKHMLSIDPLSSNHIYTEANIYYLTGRFEEAIQSLKRGLEISPTFTHNIEKIQQCFIMAGRREELDAFLDENPLAENPAGSRLLFKLVHGLPYAPQEVPKAFMQETAEHVTLLPWNLLIHTHLGEKNEALEMLGRNVENKQGQYVNFMHMPMLRPLRNEELYQQLGARAFQAPTIEQKVVEDVNTESPAVRSLMSSEEIKETRLHLDQLMNEEQVFLDATLSLRELSDKLQIHPNKLSWLLNEVFDMNFNDFVNSYRLEDFQEKALDAKNKNFTLLGLAFESGFNSKSTFNDYFKKKTGRTPRTWLKEYGG